MSLLTLCRVTMAKYCLLLLSLQYLLLNYSDPAIYLYKPYGPLLCRELCSLSDDSFIFGKEDLSCYRLKRIKYTDDLVKCLVHICQTKVKARNGTSVDAAWEDICQEKMKVHNLPKAGTEMTRPYENIYPGVIQQNHVNDLHQACEKGNLYTLLNILSGDVTDINCRGKQGRTPLMAAARNGQAKVFHFLLCMGSNVSATDDIGQTVLHAACEGGNIDIVRKLVSGDKCNIESRDTYGRTPVLRATHSGHKEVVEFLISRGVNLKATYYNGNNILHVACLSRNLDMLKYILTKDVVTCCIDSRGLYGLTPAMLSVKLGQKIFIELLVKKRCNPNVVDDYNNTILHIACTQGRTEIVNYILTHKLVHIESRGFKGRTPILLARDVNHSGMYDLLKSEGCNMKALDNQKNNILHVACLEGYIDKVEYVLSHDIVDINSRAYLGMNAVMIAVAKGNRELFELLVERGCNPKAVDVLKNTILHIACRYYQPDMVKYLVTVRFVQGMKGKKNKHGHTPLQIARTKGLSLEV